MSTDRLNILLVDDQPAKLLSYEAILGELGENLLKANSAQQALELLLKQEIAVVLVDVCMPELDGFELAAMIREHPRFKKTAIIFISAILLSDIDRLRGYELGAVDYVPVPVIPEVLRAKVRIFSELYRKTRDLEKLNAELESRVNDRTLELASSNARLMETEQRRSLALAAGHMGSWEWNLLSDTHSWDEGQYRIFGVTQESFAPTTVNLHSLVHPEDWPTLRDAMDAIACDQTPTFQLEFRAVRPNGDTRWCLVTAASTLHGKGMVERVSGVTLDITDRKQAEERLIMLAREVDHRARNVLAVTQSILNLTRSSTLSDYKTAVQGRITALARAHSLLSDARWEGAQIHKLAEEELAPYAVGETPRASIAGPSLSLKPAIAQSIALILHELATNAAKHGALSAPGGRVALSWQLHNGQIIVEWAERGGPACSEPSSLGFGTRIINTTIERQLAGSCKFYWRGEGLCCVFTIPLGENRPHALKAAPRLETAAIRSNGLTRILVVEDEALVSLMLTDMLSELGFSLVGPFSNVAEAAAALETEPVDAALLDINLNGELVYGLAEALQSRDVPFIFVTGYARESIDERFAQTPVLQKPVELDVLRNAIYSSIDAKPRLLRINSKV